MNLSTSVSRLILRYPYAEDALQWHGLSADELAASLTVEELLSLPDVDGDALLSDLENVAALYDGDDVSWFDHVGESRRPAA